MRLSKEQTKKAVIAAARRLSTGNNEHDTYGLDVEILRQHALGEDISFVVHAAQVKVRRRKAA
jgi:hypothetical protein